MAEVRANPYTVRLLVLFLMHQLASRFIVPLQHQLHSGGLLRIMVAQLFLNI
jgi:hypothetical protein